MYQFFVEPHQIQGNDIYIEGGDVRHIRNVLRMKPGEELSVSNGVDGREYRCGIVALEEDRIVCRLRFIKEEGCELASRIYLFQALPKADKMELIIQKAVELGVYEIVPVASKRCVVKLDEKKGAAKTARWQGIAEAAAKQSKRGLIPKVSGPVSFKEALAMASSMDRAMIPYEMAEDMSHTKKVIEALGPGETIGIFIGPEGGFEEEEIGQAREAGVEPVTLGRRILRTETAGLTVLAWILYHLEE